MQTGKMGLARYIPAKGGDDGVEYIGNHYWSGGHHYWSHPFSQLVEHVHQGAHGSRPHPLDFNGPRGPRLFHQ